MVPIPAAVRRFPIMLAVLVVALVIAGITWWSTLEIRSPPLIYAGPQPQPWDVSYLMIPDADPPTSPDELLDARLASFARRVDEARAALDPPIVAFGAESLRGEIEGVIARADDRARVSVHIRDLDSGRVLFDYYGAALLNPASNQKLLTTAAALELLGPDYVFETRVLRAGDTLYLVGEGDPTIDAEALELLASEVADRVTVGSLAKIVVDDSAFSPRAFGPGYSPEGWGASYMAPSGALSLNFNTVEITVYHVPGVRRPVVRVHPDSTHVVVDNDSRLGKETRIEIRSRRGIAEAEEAEGSEDQAPSAERSREGTRTRVEVEGTFGRRSIGYKVRRRVVDPGLFTGGAFALMLAEASQSEALPVEIGLAPQVDLDALSEDGDEHLGELPRLLDHDGSVDEDVELVALRRSPALIDIIEGLLTYSNNFMAEQILRTLGWRMTGAPGDWDNGGAVVRGFWEALGNDPDDLVFENGAGLSSVGRVTTSGLVDLMAVAHRTQDKGASLLDALPVAGIDGTLRTRLRRSGRRVRAKTGTMAGVSGLTGVITSEEGEPQVVFSILINVNERGAMVADARRQIEDAIVTSVLEHIDDWEAVRGTMILDLEPIDVVLNTVSDG